MGPRQQGGGDADERLAHRPGTCPGPAPPTYLVETVLARHVPSLRVCLLHRSVGFFRGLLASPSREVVVVALLAARDIRSNLGANLALVQEETKLYPWVAEMMAALEAAHLAPVHQQDSWRPPYPKAQIYLLI